MAETADWRLFFGSGQRNEAKTERLKELEPPPWRQFDTHAASARNQSELDLSKMSLTQTPKDIERGQNFRIAPEAEDVINAVNAAIYLRRPLLVTGKPGSGKTSLAYAIAWELGLGTVLSWPIDARSTVQDGLYRYDAIARLQDANQGEEQEIGKYITLGPLGTAFIPSLLPRVLLIDEIDKSDINLPNALLHLFEEGQYKIAELVRRTTSSEETQFTVGTQDRHLEAQISGGWVRCSAFPIVVMTSNGERDFPPAFKRRCIRVRMPDPTREALKTIVKAHFGENFFQQKQEKIEQLVAAFRPDDQKPLELATDQLLNSIYLLTREVGKDDETSIQNILFRRLDLAD